MSKRNEVIEQMVRAMHNAVIRDDEGEFPRLFDMLDFSGENKARTVVKALATAALDAAISVLSEPTLDMKLAGAAAITAEHMKAMENYSAADDCWAAMLSTLRSPEK